MNNRNKLLAAILVMQILIIGYIYNPGRISAPPATDLFADLQPEGVKSLEITDDQGQSITMGKEQNSWILELAPSVIFPADTNKIEELLKKIASLQSTRLVTRTEASHDRLEVGDDKFTRRLTVIPRNAETTVLYLGTAPNYKTIHVRNGNSDNVYLVSDLSSWEATTDNESWWRIKYIDFSPEELLKVGLQNSHGSFSLQKIANTWQADASQLSEPKVQDFIDQVGQILLTDVMLNKNEYPQDKPVATLQLTSKEKSVELLIWEQKEKDEDYIMKSSGSSFYVQAAPYEIKPFLKQKLADLRAETAAEAGK